MVKKIRILGKIEFDNFMKYNGIEDSNVEKFDNTFFISIIGTEKNHQHYFKESHPNVLNLKFDDIAQDADIFKAISKQQAKELYEFIKKNSGHTSCLNPEKEIIAIIHCGAGISRSGAVGEFINKYFSKQPFEEFKKTNPQICPNTTVRKILYEEVRTDKDYDYNFFMDKPYPKEPKYRSEDEDRNDIRF